MTPREFTTVVAGALCVVLGPEESDTYRPRVANAAAASALLDGFSRRVRHHPGDPAGHRMLAIAHLNAGNCKPAVHHLEIAVNILLGRAAASGCLHCTLRVRLELALLVPVLVPLYLRLGKAATARRLLSEVLLAW